jgi:peptide/nickel transport system permease protein
MPFEPVFLWSDFFLWLLVAAGIASWLAARRSESARLSLQKLLSKPTAVASMTVLAAFFAVGLLDSLHFRERLPDVPGQQHAAYGVEALSVLDLLFSHLREGHEKTYSAPFAMRLYTLENVDGPTGTVRAHPRLKFGGAGLPGEAARPMAIAGRALSGVLGALGILAAAAWAFCLRRSKASWRLPQALPLKGGPLPPKDAAAAAGGVGKPAVPAFFWALAILLLVFVPLIGLSFEWHVLGTDKVGQDVFYLALKSIRTALVIGLVTTLVVLPLGICLGLAAGYFRGFVDDAIQYLYTVLNSIPGVLLIAAAVLMMQVLIDGHPAWFSTAAERADLRLLSLCAILGMTSWTGLARLLRGEAMKLRELEYVEAARAFGVPAWRILAKHVLPNLSHIVLITLVMDFSSLVLTEAVLSYVGIGVDPSMTSFGTMINNARMELSREPPVWWSLLAAFAFMFALVLAANLLADAAREALDPKSR